MQYALPTDGYASEYNEDIEFYVACYQHSDDPLQAFIRRELEADFDRNADCDYDGSIFYTPDWRI